MSRVAILNRPGAEPSLGAVELSRRLLGEARSVSRPEECARLTRLAGQLSGVDPTGIEGDAERIAFWLNLYNALLLHGLCLRPVRGSMLRHLRLFGRLAYEVGGSVCTPNVIEHGVLRRNSRPPLHLRRALRASDPRAASSPARLDPRIHFALNCGARSCPPIRAYDPAALDEQLETATSAYFAGEARVDRERCRAVLPRLMRIYASDFGSRTRQVGFAARYLPELEECRGRIMVRYGRFDWTAVPASPLP
ncbi:MAG: DUF547 domain-containing protein [Solirubrobacterales bacterium]